jgi:hypothetical protein
MNICILKNKLFYMPGSLSVNKNKKSTGSKKKNTACDPKGRLCINKNTLRELNLFIKIQNAVK